MAGYIFGVALGALGALGFLACVIARLFRDNAKAGIKISKPAQDFNHTQIQR